MPDYTPRLQIPIPIGTEADDVPNSMMTALSLLEQSTIPRVTTTAVRDAKFGGVEVGYPVITTSPLTLWIKTSTDWANAWSDTGWIQITTLLNDWSAYRPIYYRVKSGIVYWRGILTMPSGIISGTLVPILNVPTVARPTALRRWSVTGSNHLTGFLQYDSTTGVLSGYLDQGGTSTNSFWPVPESYPND